MRYEAVGQFSGFAARTVDLTAHVPWLYLIIAPAARVVYIGETYDQGGLVVRLGRQFGPYHASTLRQRASEVAGVVRLIPPFLVISARLPYGDERGGFDGSSKQVRLLCEALMHQYVASRFVAPRSGWAIVSDPQGSRLTPTAPFLETCESIYECFHQAFALLKGLQAGAPVYMVLLDREGLSQLEDIGNLGQLLESIEVRLSDWVIALLKKEYGQDWWTDGIPTSVRVQCAERQEEEGTRRRVPPEAYLTLIDLRTIIQRNWSLYKDTMEAVCGSAGKERATQWLVDVNELRKLWAHPLKQRHLPPDPGKIAELRNLRQRLVERLKGQPSTQK